MNLHEKNSEAIKTLCEKYKVVKLYAFGSVLISDFNEEVYTIGKFLFGILEKTFQVGGK